MVHEIENRPSYTLLSVELDQSEGIQAEAGAMVSHTDSVEIETGAQVEIVGSLKRKPSAARNWSVCSRARVRSGSRLAAPTPSSRG
ncbi:AIM24 family protein [Halorhabdus salina]|uniref:AIM24 family protein n=1 Tax=Halorhabdus salina TaxID=2750670 RepID=UPI00215D852C|nr:AIM24 family protein [Halorhabdus salina]